MNEIRNKNIIKYINAKPLKSFVIENGYNTSYISTLLVSLFYDTSYIEHDLLKKIPTKIESIILQETINSKFVEPLRQCVTIESNTLNEIRNISYVLGWKNNNKINHILNNFKINDYYQFICENLNNEKILTQNTNINEMITLNLNYITLDIKPNKKFVKIMDLINDWLKSNTIKNLPSIMPFYLNRQNESLENNDNILFPIIHIDIQKRIRPLLQNNKESTDDTSNIIDWIFFSVICYKQIEDYYYCLINKDELWYIYDDKTIPSFTEVKMNNIEIINTITKECMFVIYKIGL
jgi:hypothetical protein